MSDVDDAPRFEAVDWERIDRSRRFVTAERVALVSGLAVLGVLYAYDELVAHVYLVFTWRIDYVDWAFLLSLVVVFAYVAIPALKHRASVGSTLHRLRSKPAVVLASLYLAAVAVTGLIGPLVNPHPSYNLFKFNPPLGFGSEVHTECAGRIVGSGFDEVCRGALRFPLGTARLGQPVDQLLVAGARPALYVIVIGAVLVVPIATVVGVIAGLRGGLIDRLLMSYVDLQLSLPAILIYFLAFMYWRLSLLLLLLAFGLFSWGGMARLVRSEVIQRRQNGHVRIARSLGASETYIAKRHILPNITNTLVPVVCQLLALFILYEAGIAFLGFHEASMDSWGSTISEYINAEVAGQHQTRTNLRAQDIWWVSTFPAIALTLTMLSFKLLGDGLRDALDPRGERK